MPIRLLPFIPLAWFVLEVVLLVKVGQAVGALAVVAMLAAAGLAGALLLRHVGTSLVSTLLVQDPTGRSTIERLRSAGWQVAAGLLLVLPGFASDILALLLFLPPVRSLLARLLPRPVYVRTRSGVIEGEFDDMTQQGQLRPPLPGSRRDRPGPPTADPTPGDPPPTKAPSNDRDGNPWSDRRLD